MIANNKRTWFEVRVSGGASSYKTRAEAVEQIAEMVQGYPKNAYMSYDNRAYWQRASTYAEIYRVVQTEKRVF